MLLSSKLTIDLITIPVYRFFKILYISLLREAESSENFVRIFLVTDKPGMIKRNCVQVFDVG